MVSLLGLQSGLENKGPSHLNLDIKVSLLFFKILKNYQVVRSVSAKKILSRYGNC